MAHPNAFTLSSALKVCKGMKMVSCGALVHGLCLKCGLDDSSYVENALLDMYATCSRSMDDACAVFRDIRVKIAVSWTTLITGYTHRGDGLGALRVFKQMLLVCAFAILVSSFSFLVTYCGLLYVLLHSSQKKKKTFHI